MIDCKFEKVEGGWKCSVCGRSWPFPNPPDGMNCLINPLPPPEPLPEILPKPADFIQSTSTCLGCGQSQPLPAAKERPTLRVRQ